MTTKKIAVITSEFVGRLEEAGVIPPNCRRFVIDFRVGGIAVVYAETLGDRDGLLRLADEFIEVLKEHPLLDAGVVG